MTFISPFRSQLYAIKKTAQINIIDSQSEQDPGNMVDPLKSLSQALSILTQSLKICRDEQQFSERKIVNQF